MILRGSLKGGWQQRGPSTNQALWRLQNYTPPCCRHHLGILARGHPKKSSKGHYSTCCRGPGECKIDGKEFLGNPENLDLGSRPKPRLIQNQFLCSPCKSIETATHVNQLSYMPTVVCYCQVEKHGGSNGVVSAPSSIRCIPFDW